MWQLARVKHSWRCVMATTFLWRFCLSEVDDRHRLSLYHDDCSGPIINDRGARTCRALMYSPKLESWSSFNSGSITRRNNMGEMTDPWHTHPYQSQKDKTNCSHTGCGMMVPTLYDSPGFPINVSIEDVFIRILNSTMWKAFSRSQAHM